MIHVAPASFCLARPNGEDWSECLQIEKECFGDEAWTKRGFETEMKAGARCWVTRDEDGCITGCIWFTDDEIISLGVRPHARGVGYADELMRVFLNGVPKTVPFVKLDVKPSAVPALRLYLRHGFQPISYDPNFYKRNSGALHMVKHLRQVRP